MNETDFGLSAECIAAMEELPQCMVILSLYRGEYHLLLVTNRFLEVIGVDRKDLMAVFGEKKDYFFHPDDRIVLQSKLIEMIQNPGTLFPFRLRILVGNEYRWFRGNMRAKQDARGGMLIYISTMDITEDHNRHRRDKIKDILLEKVLETTQTCMFWKDTKRRFVGVNQAFLDFYGFPSDEVLIGKTDEDMGWHDDPEPFKSDEERVLAGATTHLVHGTCRVHGKNRDIFATKAPAYDGDEIIGLVGSFIDATETFSQQRKIEELKQELERALDKERQLNAEMGMFMSRLSHELRTPMNAVIGLSTLGLEQETLASAKEYLDNIRISGKYLLQIINEVLELNKVESGDLKLNLESTDLKEILRDLHAILDPIAAEKGISLMLDDSGIEYGNVCCDKVRLEQILINLLNNAVKFTERGGHVGLFVKQRLSGQYVEMAFKVEDDGCGISSDFLPKIFRPFAQENRNPSKYGNGTGLGLTISQSFIRLMGGDISVESEENKGTRFLVTVKFPLACKIERKEEEVFREDSFESLKGLRALLAEDNMINQKVAAGILGRVGMYTDVAENGVELVRLFEQSPPGFYDVILMDIHMPYMDGFEASRQVRGLERADAAQVPIVAMSADIFDASVEMARKSGMTGYVTKPLDMDTLYSEILRQVGKKTGSR
ncbi:MAG: response regulator [Lachnospiraceae bacterium]|nr:response regulator [Lachnospiraceae bacterium]